MTIEQLKYATTVSDIVEFLTESEEDGEDLLRDLENTVEGFHDRIEQNEVNYEETDKAIRAIVRRMERLNRDLVKRVTVLERRLNSQKRT